MELACESLRRAEDSVHVADSALAFDEQSGEVTEFSVQTRAVVRWLLRILVGPLWDAEVVRPKSVIRVTAYTAGGIWSITAAVAGLQFDDTEKKLLGFVPIVLVLLFTVWDRWAWKWKIFVGHSGVPDLNGTWLGEYEAEWVDEHDARGTKSAPAALSIKQNFTTLSLTLITSESKSYSLLSHIANLDSGEYRVNYEYSNTALPKYRKRLPNHLGSAELTIATARGADLTGEYWTNRMSRGTLRFQWVSRDAVNTLDAARQLPNKVSERDA